MKIADCFYLGYISKIIGNSGELAFKLDVDSPSSYNGLDAVFIRINKNDDTLVPFFIKHAKLQQKNILRVSIEGINSQTEAKEIVGKELFLPASALPPLKGNQFYYHEVIGFTIIDEVFGKVGELIAVLDYPSQDIFQVMAGEKEVLIPILENTIQKVDRPNKNILIKTTEGLIELYLEA